jgi:hypothetical protein
MGGILEVSAQMGSGGMIYSAQSLVQAFKKFVGIHRHTFVETNRMEIA